MLSPNQLLASAPLRLVSGEGDYGTITAYTGRRPMGAGRGAIRPALGADTAVSRLLVECGEALYGSRWQCEMARDLGIADRTVRRWVAGVTPVPCGVYLDLLRMVVERQAMLDDLASRLPEAGVP